MLAYVEKHNYLGSWINRADTGFVLQMGGFFSNTKRPPPTIDSIRNVATFVPVQGQPAAQLGLSNTVGTVSLALPGDGMGGTNQDAGTSSFFVNLTDNSFLDADFTVFAAIPDMTTINNIMALMTVDRTTEPDFGAGSGNLAFTNVPVQDNGFQVFIKRAFAITDTLTTTKDIAGVQSLITQSASAAANPLLAAGDGNSSAVGAPSLSSMIVPEPASMGLALLATLGFGGFVRRGHRERLGS